MPSTFTHAGKVTDSLAHFKRRMRAQLVRAVGSFGRPQPSPDELLGELFQDVQLRHIYHDSMTFVDLVPASKMRQVLKIYKQERQNSNFDLTAFVHRHFKEYITAPQGYVTKPGQSIEQHINELWDVLTRETYQDSGSLLALPYPYIVPGGRFGAQWYWDSYFTMLGLAASDRWDLVDGMLKNFAFLIRKFGFIPSGNRTYYASRSQPPFFASMVQLLARRQGKAALVKYLPYLLREYRFWMKGNRRLTAEVPSFRRVVRLPSGELLNRYFDNKSTPRPESYREDVETAQRAKGQDPARIYLDIRAAAESGWDFSSRWLRDGQHLHTIHTTDILPVDLNCLLHYLEETIAEAYQLLKQPLLAQRYSQKAEARAKAIRQYCWSEEQQFFVDYDFSTQSQKPQLTLAGIYPLYVGIATPSQATAAAKTLQEKFLLPGGLTTTLIDSGQQWDLPNGWALLQWVAIEGLRQYKQDALADEITKRWIATNQKVYKTEGKLVEKYNVVRPGSAAGGGEYPLQDGFGMTNGVLMALLAQKSRKR